MKVKIYKSTEVEVEVKTFRLDISINRPVMYKIKLK